MTAAQRTVQSRVASVESVSCLQSYRERATTGHSSMLYDVRFDSKLLFVWFNGTRYTDAAARNENSFLRDDSDLIVLNWLFISHHFIDCCYTLSDCIFTLGRYFI